MATNSPSQSKHNKTMHGLDAREQKFVERYFISGVASSAMVEAGYAKSSAAKMAALKLQDPRIIAYLNELRSRQMQLMQVKADSVAQELKNIAFSDPRELFDDNGKLIDVHKLPAHVAHAVAKYKVDKDGKVEIFFWDKPKALDMLAKHFGFYEADNRQKSLNGLNFGNLSSKQLKVFVLLLEELQKPPKTIDITSQEV